MDITSPAAHKEAKPETGNLFVRLPTNLKQPLDDFVLRRKLARQWGYQSVRDIVTALVGAFTRAQLDTIQPFDRARARDRFLGECGRVFDDMYPLPEDSDGGAS